MAGFRTDLALEANEMHGATAPAGVTVEERTRRGFAVTTVRIKDEQGEKELCKPKGSYVTVRLDAFLRREDNAFDDGVQVIAEALRSMLGPGCGGSVLVAGLGNAEVTPDALGPFAARHTLATRHLTGADPARFGAFRPVSVLETGVLGTTGMESAELLHAVCDRLHPDCVIAVDALASHSPAHICRTVQITDTGLIPGSGVGNRRTALDRQTLGVPVIAVGVPTVVDAAAVGTGDGLEGMIVTPRDIDARVRDTGRLIGYALDLALHDGLTVEDVDALVG